MNYTHFVGLDLHQQDYTARTILEELAWAGERAARHVSVSKLEWPSPAGLTDWQVEQALAWATHYGRPSASQLASRHPERPPLGTSYPRAVEYVTALVSTPPQRPQWTVPIVDWTGASRGAVD